MGHEPPQKIAQVAHWLHRQANLCEEVVERLPQGAMRARRQKAEWKARASAFRFAAEALESGIELSKTSPRK